MPFGLLTALSTIQESKDFFLPVKSFRTVILILEDQTVCLADSMYHENEIERVLSQMSHPKVELELTLYVLVFENMTIRGT